MDMVVTANLVLAVVVVAVVAVVQLSMGTNVHGLKFGAQKQQTFQETAGTVAMEAKGALEQEEEAVALQVKTLSERADRNQEVTVVLGARSTRTTKVTKVLTATTPTDPQCQQANQEVREMPWEPHLPS